MFLSVFLGLILLYFIIAVVDDMFTKQESSYCGVAKLIVIVIYTFCFIKYTGLF